MKRAAMTTIVVVGIAACSFAQSNPPAPQNTQAGQPAGQPAPAPTGKRPPQAKTQPEFDAYKTAAALTDPAAQEKAADDFAAKFADSELRAVLYKSAMHGYQQTNNDPEALLGVAQVLAERTRDTDLDKDQRLAEAKKDAQRALSTVETDIPTAGQPPDRIEAYKSFLRSEAYAILGTLEYNAKAWPEAEGDLRKSIDAFPQQVDPIAVLRLSIALDNQKRYPEALKYASQAVELTKEGTNAGAAARAEKDRLTKLNSGTEPTPSSAPPKN
jgi:tetratricopeptide (TPR) repeat protein